MRPLRRSRGRSRQGGFTLAELLVALAISMALVLAVTLMVMRFETARRALTASNDNTTGGNYAAYALDRLLRSAGSGYVQLWRQAYGCRLLAARSGTQLLPRASAFPAPYAAVPRDVRLAPLVVHAGAGSGGSDVLGVFTGASALSETPVRVLPGSATDHSLRVPATVGLRAQDLVLVIEDGTRCMLQQVASGFAGGATQTLDLGGTYAAQSIDGVALNTMAVTEQAWLAPLGNTSGNRPGFQLLGVAANGVLSSLDLLRLDGSDSILPLAEGVADLRALYGIDSDGDGRVDSWVDPAAAPWTAGSLLDGTPAAQQNLARILAVRVGLLMRSAVPQRQAVSPATLTLFADLGTTLRRQRTLSSDERLLRWQAVEFTVPLRNAMLKP